MGIPHGVKPKGDRFDRMGSNDAIQGRGQSNTGDEFQSFEDTFKPMKKVEKSPTSVKPPPSNFVDDFDNMPIPAAKHHPKPYSQEPSSFEPDAAAHSNFDDMPIKSRKDNSKVNSSSKSLKSSPKKSSPPKSVPSDPNVVNPDEIVIKPKEKLTFEEMLENELKSSNIIEDDDRVIRKKPKKEFLKRTKKTEAAPQKTSQKYKYYADNFEKGKPKSSNKISSENGGSQEEETEKVPITKSENQEEKRAFLVRGSGTAGGKRQGNEEEQQQITQVRNNNFIQF